jgi:hypothetical protein
VLDLAWSVISCFLWLGESSTGSPVEAGGATSVTHT